MADNEDKPRFDLVESPWIRCVMTDGRVATLSLGQVFRQAHEIVRLSGDSPQQDYALFRTLLVIFWRAHRHDMALQGWDPDYQEWWLEQFQGVATEEFWGPVERYLDEHRHRFDLLDPVAPFMQVADLRTAKDTQSAIGRLLPDSESDYFSMRAGPGLQGVSFAEAARQVISMHAWDYSGIKSGAVGDERVKGGKGYPIGTGWHGRTGGVVLSGENLGQSILLNTVPEEVFDEEDLPVWEREPDTARARENEVPAGPNDLLTWQARRIRLFENDGLIDGVIVANGDRIERKNEMRDPMTAYRHSTNLSKKGNTVWMAREHAAERTLWRGIQPLLVREGMGKYQKGAEPDQPPKTVRWLLELTTSRVLDLDFPVGVELVGMVYGNQDAVLEDGIDERLTLRLAALADPQGVFVGDILTSAQSAMDAAIEIGKFAGNLLVAAGGEYAFVKEPTESVLAGLTAPYRQWLSAIKDGIDMNQHLQNWFKQVRKAVLNEAGILVRGAGPRAIIGVLDGERLVSAATATSQLHRALNRLVPIVNTEQTNNAKEGE